MGKKYFIIDLTEKAHKHCRKELASAKYREEAFPESVPLHCMFTKQLSGSLPRWMLHSKVFFHIQININISRGARTQIYCLPILLHFNQALTGVFTVALQLAVKKMNCDQKKNSRKFTEIISTALYSTAFM